MYIQTLIQGVENLLHSVQRNARSRASVSGHEIFIGHLVESPMRNSRNTENVATKKKINSDLIRKLYIA